jgi:YYY domain-containing protein
LEITPILIWWLIILIFGLVGWPLAFSLFRWLPDRGFALARPVGLLTTGYILWLGGTFRLLQNNIGGALVALVLVLALGVLWRRRQAAASESMLAWLKREWRYALTIELLFSLALVGWTIFKAYNPNIETSGGEKWMEITFINGVLRSDYFPPQDPWLSGFAISYYYFGYVLMAMITRLTGLVSTVAFNLYIPTLLALTLCASCSLLTNLVSLSSTHQPPSAIRHLHRSAILTGLLAALFVALLGHWEGLLEVFHKAALFPADFWVWLDIRDLKVPPTGPSDSWLPDRFIWWWRGSRVLTDYTLSGREQEVIDEFPFFSFLLGDVHPHVLGLPFVLLVASLGLNLLANRLPLFGLGPTDGQRPGTLHSEPSTASLGAVAGVQFWAMLDRLQQILHAGWFNLLIAVGGRRGFLLYALFLGSLSFLNTWDFPIYLGLVGLCYLAWLADRSMLWRTVLEPGLVGIGILGLVGVLLYVPFYATFQSQARGILPNLWNPTRLPQLLIFFGPFMIALIGLLATFSHRQLGWRPYLGSTVLLTVLGPLVVMLVVLSSLLFSQPGREYVQGILNHPDVQQILGETTISALVQASLWRRVANPWTFLFIGGLLGWALALFMAGLEDSEQADAKLTDEKQTATVLAQRGIPEQFALILIVVGLTLPLSVEFIFLRDNFGYRMNTIFKFYFQAWVLLALASAFAVYYVSKYGRGWLRLAWQVGLVLGVAAGLVYPVLALPNKADFFQNPPRLDGMAWIATHRPGDYTAIQWLRANAASNAVILEAPGAPIDPYGGYNYSSRISAMTGLPTLLGWGGHQNQWRGNYDEPARREPDIELLYNTPDIGQAVRLLDKYGVTYVIVGALERERYAPAGLTKFDRFMDIAFQQDEVIIYQRR